MRKIILALVAAASIGLAAPRAARAQTFGAIGGPVTVAPLSYQAPAPGYPMPSYGAPRVIQGLYVPHYSYSRAPYPYPARVYNGYGSNDFAFYGRPYGHAWEPWSWSALSQYPAYPTGAYMVLGP